MVHFHYIGLLVAVQVAQWHQPFPSCAGWRFPVGSHHRVRFQHFSHALHFVWHQFVYIDYHQFVVLLVHTAAAKVLKGCAEGDGVQIVFHFVCRLFLTQIPQLPYGLHLLLIERATNSAQHLTDICSSWFSRSLVSVERHRYPQQFFLSHLYIEYKSRPIRVPICFSSIIRSVIERLTSFCVESGIAPVACDKGCIETF